MRASGLSCQADAPTCRVGTHAHLYAAAEFMDLLVRPPGVRRFWMPRGMTAPPIYRLTRLICTLTLIFTPRGQPLVVSDQAPSSFWLAGLFHFPFHGHSRGRSTEIEIDQGSGACDASNSSMRVRAALRSSSLLRVASRSGALPNMCSSALSANLLPGSCSRPRST